MCTAFRHPMLGMEIPGTAQCDPSIELARQLWVASWFAKGG